MTLQAKDLWPGHDWVEPPNRVYLYQGSHGPQDPYLWRHECRRCGLIVKVWPSKAEVGVGYILNGYITMLYEVAPGRVPSCGAMQALVEAASDPLHDVTSPEEVSRARGEMLAEIDEIISPWWVGGRADTIRWMAWKLKELGVESS